MPPCLFALEIHPSPFTQGRHGYFSSRNNNFSNRKQAGMICVAGTLNGQSQGTCTGGKMCLEMVEDELKALQHQETILNYTANPVYNRYWRRNEPYAGTSTPTTPSPPGSTDTVTPDPDLDRSPDCESNARWRSRRQIQWYQMQWWRILRSTCSSPRRSRAILLPPR